MIVGTTTQIPHPIRLHWGHTRVGVYSKVKTHSKQPQVLILSRDKLPLLLTTIMHTQDVVAGTVVYKSIDKEDGRVFFWYRTPDGQTGGVAERDGRIPAKEEAVLIIPDSGKPFIGFKELNKVLTY